MYYIVDADTKEVVSEVNSWEETFRKELSLQRCDAESEVYREYEIVEASET